MGDGRVSTITASFVNIVPTLGDGLFFSAESRPHLSAYSDADCASCLHTRRSTTG